MAATLSPIIQTRIDGARTNAGMMAAACLLDFAATISEAIRMLDRPQRAEDLEDDMLEKRLNALSLTVTALAHASSSARTMSVEGQHKVLELSERLVVGKSLDLITYTDVMAAITEIGMLASADAASSTGY